MGMPLYLLFNNLTETCMGLQLGAGYPNIQSQYVAVTICRESEICIKLEGKAIEEVPKYALMHEACLQYFIISMIVLFSTH